MCLSWCGGSIQVTSNAWWDRSHGTPPDGDPPRWRTPPGWRAPPRWKTPAPEMEGPPRWRTPQMENPPRWRTPPGWRTPPQSMCGWYASYWNAFLLTKLSKMAILASEALPREKNPVAKCYPPGGNRTQSASDSKSNTILSTQTWHVLLRRSLNFCSCTTWYLDLDDLRRINRAWLYKEPKVSVL